MFSLSLQIPPQLSHRAPCTRTTPAIAQEKLFKYDERLKELRHKEREFIMMQKLKQRTDVSGRGRGGVCWPLPVMLPRTRLCV